MVASNITPNLSNQVTAQNKEGIENKRHELGLCYKDDKNDRDVRAGCIHPDDSGPCYRYQACKW